MNKQQAFVIDNGTDRSKIGISNDLEPLYIISTKTGKNFLSSKKQKKNPNKYIQQFKEDSILNMNINPIENGIITNWEDMYKLWNVIFEEKLQKNCSQQDVILSEPFLNPQENREKQIKIFFEDFRVGGYSVYNQSVLSLFSSGRTTGLVCDLGEGQSNMCVVYEGYVLKQTFSEFPITGLKITEFLAKHLVEDGLKIESMEGFEIAKQIKETLSYMAIEYEKEYMEFNQNVQKKDFLLPDGNQIKIGDILIRTTEGYMRPSLFGYEIPGLQDQLLQTFYKAPEELKDILSQSIFLSGGNSNYENFDERMLKELQKLETNENFNIIDQDNRHMAVWQGASILSSLSSFQYNWVTKNEYLEYGVNIVHRKCFQFNQNLLFNNDRYKV